MSAIGPIGSILIFFHGLIWQDLNTSTSVLEKIIKTLTYN